MKFLLLAPLALVLVFISASCERQTWEEVHVLHETYGELAEKRASFRGEKAEEEADDSAGEPDESEE